MKFIHYIYIALRTLLAICLLTLLSLQFAARITGYVRCVAVAYAAAHRGLPEDCDCKSILADAFDGNGQNKHLAATPVQEKMPDFAQPFPDLSLTAPVAPAATQRPTVPKPYRYTAARSVFRPPSPSLLPSML
ncbi:hypothetical protein ACWKWU_19145 [Chitinophaga lutea]